MKKILSDIDDFMTNGWHKTTLSEAPKNFISYFIGYSLNWLTTLATILFIGLFLYGEMKYQAPMFYMMSVIPFLILAYNTASELNAYKKGLNEKLLYILFCGACVADFLALIAMLFLKQA